MCSLVFGYLGGLLNGVLCRLAVARLLVCSNRIFDIALLDWLDLFVLISNDYYL